MSLLRGGDRDTGSSGQGALLTLWEVQEGCPGEETEEIQRELARKGSLEELGAGGARGEQGFRQ